MVSRSRVSAPGYSDLTLGAAEPEYQEAAYSVTFDSRGRGHTWRFLVFSVVAALSVVSHIIILQHAHWADNWTIGKFDVDGSIAADRCHYNRRFTY